MTHKRVWCLRKKVTELNYQIAEWEWQGSQELNFSNIGTGLHFNAMAKGLRILFETDIDENLIDQYKEILDNQERMSIR